MRKSLLFTKRLLNRVLFLILEVYPRGYELRSSPKNFTEQEIQSKKKELKNIKSEFLATADEASTIKQVRSK